MEGNIISTYLTGQRKQLLSLFKDNMHESYSAKQVADKLKDCDISVSAIYRNLASMEKDGLLCRVASSVNREALYQYVDPHTCVGVIHLICDKCSQTHHLDKNVSSMIISMAEENFGFKVNKQLAMIYGLCRNCSQIHSEIG